MDDESDDLFRILRMDGGLKAGGPAGACLARSGDAGLRWGRRLTTWSGDNPLEPIETPRIGCGVRDAVREAQTGIWETAGI